MNAPKVFISYSWDSKAHKKWVRKLALRLIENGIEISLDRLHLVPGYELPTFMSDTISENDFVLVICTPAYKLKSDKQRDTSYEGYVINGETFVQGYHSKFIPVLRKGEWPVASPSALTDKLYIDLSATSDYEANYVKLLETLYGKHEKAPKLVLGKVKTALCRLEELMMGDNFEVCLGIELFTECSTYDTFNKQIRKVFPKSRPELAKVTQIDQQYFWEKINYCLNYHGDIDPGLDAKQCKAIKEHKIQIEREQKVYTSFLSAFINEKARFFSYPDTQGIPGYPLWWDYRFIIFNEADQCLFTYGSASD
jgi:TIR domain